jgi:hypothetical protein
VPHSSRIGVLMNSANPANGFFFDVMSFARKTLGLRLRSYRRRVGSELDGAIARAKGGALSS